MFCNWFLAIAQTWQEPTAAPPGGNVDVPINVGSVDQYKTGKLGVYSSGIDTNYGLTVGSGIKVTNTGTGNTLYLEDEPNDPTPFVVDASGNVGIGTTTPAGKLDIVGGSLAVEGDPGNSGQFLKSQEVGASPVWDTPPILVHYPIVAEYTTQTGGSWLSPPVWENWNLSGSVPLGTKYVDVCGNFGSWTNNVRMGVRGEGDTGDRRLSGGFGTRSYNTVCWTVVVSTNRIIQVTHHDAGLVFYCTGYWR